MNGEEKKKAAKERHDAVNELIVTKGLSIADACEELGVHKSNYYHWRKMFDGVFETPKKQKKKTKTTTYEAVPIQHTATDTTPFAIQGSPAQLAAFVKSLSQEFSR